MAIRAIQKACCRRYLCHPIPFPGSFTRAQQPRQVKNARTFRGIQQRQPSGEPGNGWHCRVTRLKIGHFRHPWRYRSRASRRETNGIFSARRAVFHHRGAIACSFSRTSSHCAHFFSFKPRTLTACESFQSAVPWRGSKPECFLRHYPPVGLGR